MNDRVTLERALVQRICAQVAYEPGPGVSIDRGASFFSADGFHIGEYQFDSMDLVEMMLTLEDEFEISIVEGTDLEDIDTIEKLSSFIAASAPDGRVAKFCRSWS